MILTRTDLDKIESYLLAEHAGQEFQEWAVNTVPVLVASHRAMYEELVALSAKVSDMEAKLKILIDGVKVSSHVEEM